MPKSNASASPDNWYLDYLAYLKSKAWADRRTAWFAEYGCYCRACGATDFIQLHHKTYVRLRREDDGDLVGLCGDCHQKVHKLEREEGIPLGKATKAIIWSKGKPETIPPASRPKPKRKGRSDGRRWIDIVQHTCPLCGARPKRPCFDKPKGRLHIERAVLAPVVRRVREKNQK